ncbi:MAG TPA: hypothetical protein VIF60_23860 [Burkholderiaceae bacterium]
MRDDMFKVIVERPRLVNSNGYSGDGRPYRDREDGPLRLGMKKGYNSKKYLNENLRPLQRFLESRVNRPWNKVYSEICENIDTRNTVKQHILQHIEDFVIVKTGWEDDGDGGHVTAYLDYGGHSRLEEVNRALYVHPLTGILLRNRKYLSRSAKNRKIREADDAARSTTHRVISRRVQLHCIEGIWYELDLREIPPAQRIPYHHSGEARIRTVYSPVWDVMRQCRVDGGSLSVDWSVPRRYRAFYGDPNLYAASKRQLGAKELRKHGLTNKARAGLVSFYLAIARTIWQCLLWHATCSKKARQKPA